MGSIHMRGAEKPFLFFVRNVKINKKTIVLGFAGAFRSPE